MRIWASLTAVLALASAAGAAEPNGADEARLLRFPAIHGDQIVFTYAGDLYTVPATGGTARRLTSDVGFEMFARFSPDGKQIAFTGQYDGNTEVYVMPAEGGTPRRLTYTATLHRDDVSDRMGPNNIVMGWTPDGQRIVFRSRMQLLQRLHRPTLYGVARRRPAGAAALAARRLLLLLARRQEAGLQPRLPRVPHLEALPRRHGRRRMDLRFRDEKDRRSHRRIARRFRPRRAGRRSPAEHHPHVVGRQDLFPVRPRRPQTDEPLRPGRRREDEDGAAAADDLHRLRREVPVPGRPGDRLRERRLDLSPRPGDGEGRKSADPHPGGLPRGADRAGQRPEVPHGFQHFAGRQARPLRARTATCSPCRPSPAPRAT